MVEEGVWFANASATISLVKLIGAPTNIVTSMNIEIEAPAFVAYVSPDTYHIHITASPAAGTTNGNFRNKLERASYVGCVKLFFFCREIHATSTHSSALPFSS